MATQKSALLVVDVQNDFCPGGALAVAGGDQVVPVLNEYIERFTNAGLPVYASRDWHPAQSQHFLDSGGAWPPHCVQRTPGAAFNADLRLPRDVAIITKGAGVNDEGYSPFEGSLPGGGTFAERLQDDEVAHLYIGGLATDYCVRASVLDARKAGLQVTLLLDAVRGVNLKPDDARHAIEEMHRAGADMGTLETVAVGSWAAEPPLGDDLSAASAKH